MPVPCLPACLAPLVHQVRPMAQLGMSWWLATAQVPDLVTSSTPGCTGCTAVLLLSGCSVKHAARLCHQPEVDTCTCQHLCCLIVQHGSSACLFALIMGLCVCVCSLLLCHSTA